MLWQVGQYNVPDCTCESSCTRDHARKAADQRLKSAYGNSLACLLSSTMQNMAAKLKFHIDVTQEKWKYRQCAPN